MENLAVPNPVQEPVVPVVESPASPSKPGGRSGVLLILLVMLLLLSLASTAFLYYQNMQLKNMVASYQTPIASLIPTAIADQTADWKNLTGSDWVLKIPNNWHYLGCNPGDTLFIDPNQIHENDNQTVECNFGPTAKIWITKIKNDQPIPTPFVVNNTAENFKSETFSLEISDKEQFILDNKTGVIQKETYRGGPNQGTTLSVYIKDKGISYIISLSDLDLKDIFLKILSTFKFTN